jgi:NTE family protein
VGVFHALTEAGIRVDSVVGTSSGALVGAMYAAGQLEAFEREVRGLEWRDVLALFTPVWPRSGLLSGTRGLERLAGMLGDWTFDDLALPFAAVSVDLVSGDEVLIRKGRVLDAIRASTSVPGLFIPERTGRRLLVDGALRNPVPGSARGEMGAEVRVAVNLHHQPVREIVHPPTQAPAHPGGRPTIATRVTDAIERRLARFRKRAQGGAPTPRPTAAERGVPNLFEILTASTSIMEYELAQHRLARDPPDVLIEPDVHGIRAFEFHKASRAIHSGHIAASARIAELERAARRRTLRRRRA